MIDYIICIAVLPQIPRLIFFPSVLENFSLRYTLILLAYGSLLHLRCWAFTLIPPTAAYDDGHTIYWILKFPSRWLFTFHTSLSFRKTRIDTLSDIYSLVYHAGLNCSYLIENIIEQPPHYLKCWAMHHVRVILTICNALSPTNTTQFRL